jgi:replicative DNA helicase
MDSRGRIPPYSDEAERAVLGAILMRPEVLHEVEDKVSPDIFYARRHYLIFEAILNIARIGRAIDLLTITEELRSRGFLEEAGGASYLAELVSSVPASTHAPHYATLVFEKFMRRELVRAASAVGELGFDESMPLPDTLDMAEKTIYATTHRGTSRTIHTMRDTLDEAWERIEKNSSNEEGMRGVPTGFQGLDNLLSGFQPSDLIILAARPSVGKTALALDIARNAATRHDVPVGIFSLEMSRHQLVDRMLSAESRVKSWELRTGRVKTSGDLERIRDALDRLSRAPIFIDDAPGVSLVQMRSAGRKLKREHNIGLLIVDYLQLIQPATYRVQDSAVQQVTEISRGLKQLARELEVPVLALSQLSREVEKRGGKPRLSDLRDSGSIEQDADVVMFIHREDRTNMESDSRRRAEILVEKHRNGPTGKVDLVFDDEKTTFVSVDKSDFGPFNGNS